ncbi:ABC transporter substrate-binding protein [Vagococcus elongatus]|uniref:ABC transporter substrate-binding protein n=1 Tax=Vagococcus elongatus TaxID=180344 RepID=A0A430B230_9ENTE|nr:ABC transporter substrate-binding protein [Vagococcus elongatus]RSU14311.1 ABC transporter substrate-binding protein [Vagococcus elongatus]
MKKIIKFLSVSIITAVLFTGCGKGEEKTPAESSEKIEETKKDFSGQTMNVVTTSEAYIELFDKFSEETGAKVEFLSMSSGEVISRMKAEKDKPMADLWFGGGLDAFIQAKDDGLLEKYTSPALDDVPETYKDEDGYWLSKGITVAGLLVNNGVIEEKGLDVPKTWADLTDPQYKDEVIMSDPAVSGTMYAVVKGLLDKNGDEGWDYWEKVNDNISFYGKRGKDPQEKTAAGEFAVGIIPVDKSAFDAAEEEDLTVIYPEDGVPWVPEGVAIFKNSEGTEIAKAFVDFMLEDENLALLAKLDGKDSDQVVKPGIKGLDLGLAKEDLIEEDLTTFGSSRTEILKTWAEMVGDK